MKTRPLCFMCLLFVSFQSIFMIAKSGESIWDIPASSIFYEQEEKSVLIEGQVYKKTNTSNIQILYLKNNSTNDSKLLIYSKNLIEIPIGKRIRLQGTTGFFEKSRNPGNFDQAFYYAKQDIYGMIWCDKVLQISGEENWLMEKLYQLKIQWKENLCNGMGEENGAILSAMLLGERSEMDPEMKELYQINGISHILAISGLHISFIGLGIYRLIRKTGLGFVLSGIGAILVLSLYALMIGFSVSVLRAFIMLIFRIGGDMSGRVYDMLTALMVAAAITVGGQPLYLVDAGFLLSYGAILGILFVLPALERVLKCRWKWMSGCYASIAINIMLFPILLWFYFEIPTYSIFLNMLVIPLMSILLGFGMVGSILGFWLQPAAKICLWICGMILKLYEMLSRMGSQLPMARLVIGQPKMWTVILYYIILVGVIIYVSKCKKQKKFYLFIYGIALFLMMYKPNGDLLVTVMDVGQGDGIFIQGPEGTTYFIDGGSSDVEQLGKYRIEPFLKSQGVGMLDYVFITHGDTDHYSGIEEMLGRQELGVKIKHLVLPTNWKQDEALTQLAKLALSENVDVVTIQAGQSISEGELKINCVQPIDTDKSLSGNAGSMVLAIYYKEFSMLCTGDVEAEGEEKLTGRLKGQDFDVLKVSHHGSKNSTTELFLKTIKPEIALISAGDSNSYGHPHEETLERLNAIGCKVYETIKNGAITLRTDGNSLTIF